VIKSVVVLSVTIIIWNCVGKDCYGRDNSAFRYWFRVLQKTSLMVNYVHCYREQRFISTWRLKCCSRWTEELVLCLVKTLNKGTNAFQWRYWFVSLNPADIRSTIPFLYIDEVKRKAPTWLQSQSHMYIRRSATLNFRDGKDRNSWDTHFRVNKGNILHKKYINL
jgi:hypothetical protein